jgi:glucokinase
MKIIGIDLGGTVINAGLVSSGKLEKVIDEKIKKNGKEKEIILQITGIIDKLIDDEVKAIGIAVPAQVDGKGVVYETVNIPSWKRVELKSILQKKYSIPVFVNNDANCFALGEKNFGICNGYRNIAGVTIGTGFGVGLIINNELYSGANCVAGEYGRIIFKEKELEDYCSGKFFREKYKTPGEILSQKARKGDKKALKIFHEFGDNLGKALAIIANTVDPECIVLGGSVAKDFKLFEKSMLSSLQKHTYKRSFSRLKVCVSEIKDITILGAAQLCYDNFQNIVVKSAKLKITPSLSREE